MHLLDQTVMEWGNYRMTFWHDDVGAREHCCGHCWRFANAGDEVVQWNGIRLRGLTFEEVYDIIFESKFDPQVELTVYRPVGNTQQRRGDAECLTEGLSLAQHSRFHANYLGYCLAEVMSSPVLSVSMSVCLSVSRITKTSMSVILGRK